MRGDLKTPTSYGRAGHDRPASQPVGWPVNQCESRRAAQPRLNWIDPQAINNPQTRLGHTCTILNAMQHTCMYAIRVNGLAQTATLAMASDGAS